MRAIFFFFSSILILQSCSSDFLLTHQMIGEFKVKLETTEAKEEISSKQQEIEQKTEEAKRKINESIERGKGNIAEDAPFSEGLSSLLDGLGKVAKGAADLGEAIGTLTLNIGDELLDISGVMLQLKKDGTGKFGTKKWNANIQWKVENGQIYFWGKNENYSVDTDGLTIKRLDGDNFVLIGNDVKIHLERVENDK